MAMAIAESGFESHIWARRATTLEEFGEAEHTSQKTYRQLGAQVDLVCICVPTDDDVLRLAGQELLDVISPGSVRVHRGSGPPGNAMRPKEMTLKHRVASLDSPISGGQGGGGLTTLAGGKDAVLAR